MKSGCSLTLLLALGPLFACEGNIDGSPLLGHQHVREGIRRQAAEASDFIISLQRSLHAIPELKHEEHQTSAFIRQTLEGLGIAYRHPVAGTGVTADIGHGLPVVALRADMDALAIEEEGESSFKSVVLKQQEGNFAGTVRLIFQPAEEGGGGALKMVQDGALAGVAAAFGLHVWPAEESGVFSTKAGAIMASSSDLRVVISGRGGHAAIPHGNVDPVVAVAAAVSALQTIVSRNVSPMDAVVLSITRMQAGEAYNIIPGVAEFGGTLRAFKPEAAELARRRIREVVDGIAAAFGCTAHLSWREDVRSTTPATWNNPRLAALAADVASGLYEDSYRELLEPSMAAEDFSVYAERVPACFMFLGVRNASRGSVHALHSAQFTLDESVLHRGAALLAQLAIKPEASAPVFVIGDTHGQLADVLLMLTKTGFPDKEKYFIFNGDFVDRGAWGVETVLAIAALKLALPNRVFMIRGNHESSLCTKYYGFQQEIKAKYPAGAGRDKAHRVITKLFLDMFKLLPLAALVSESTLVVHGGLWRKPPPRAKRQPAPKRVCREGDTDWQPGAEGEEAVTLGSLEDLRLSGKGGPDPQGQSKNKVASDALWSDPSPEPGLRVNSTRQVGLLFGPDVTEQFLRENNLKLIVRSHEGPDARWGRDNVPQMDTGYTVDHDTPAGRLVTVFSAPDYPQFQADPERYNNQASVLRLLAPTYAEVEVITYGAAPRPASACFYDLDIPGSDTELPDDGGRAASQTEEGSEDEGVAAADIGGSGRAAEAGSSAGLAAPHDQQTSPKTAATQRVAAGAAASGAAASDAAMKQESLHVAAEPREASEDARPGGGHASADANAAPADAAASVKLDAGGSSAKRDVAASAAVLPFAATLEAARGVMKKRTRAWGVEDYNPTPCSTPPPEPVDARDAVVKEGSPEPGTGGAHSPQLW